MAGGPLGPYSAMPTTADAFSDIQNIATKIDHEEGFGVEASLSGDTIWRLRFKIPPALPTGDPYINVDVYANATAGVAKVNPKWKSVAVEADFPLAASLSAETVQTITWAAGDDRQKKQLQLQLDATTVPAAEEILYMDLTFETSSWTLAADSIWAPVIIWK